MSEKHARAEALREAADAAMLFAATVYAPDIFPRPTSAEYAEINKVLLDAFGHQLDGVAADCYSRAITVQARLLRERADDIEGDAA